MGPRRKASENTAICEPVCTAPDGFNGAEAQSLGKSLARWPPAVHHLASMGPRRKASENQHAYHMRDALRAASMGPRRKASENQHAYHMRDALRAASMGPRRKASENQPRRQNVRPAKVASMGPRRKASENNGCLSMEDKHTRSFNGAEAQSLGK